MKSTPRIIIIGGGLQGLSTALALAHRGFPSILLEQKPEILCGASYGNEGKIHLGHVYAMDASLRTGITMMRGATSFAPLLERWCGRLDWARWRCTPFRYAVMPGSLASVSYLESYYETLWSTAQRTPGISFDNYLGTKLTSLWSRSTTKSSDPALNGVPIPCIQSTELAIDTRYFNPALAQILQSHRLIHIQREYRVADARRLGDHFVLSLETPNGPAQLKADIVINCAWSDRIRLDTAVGFAHHNPHQSYRVKHRILVKPKHPIGHLIPITMVQGPFGDMVPFRDGLVYLSWYPECRTYFADRPPLAEATHPETLERISRRTVEVFGEFYPALENAQVVSCKACIIVAKGDTDVHDPTSELHQRSEGGPQGSNGWWSVDTSKLTLAPLYGEETARLVMEEMGVRQPSGTTMSLDAVPLSA
jgi:glycine/D-amino acid oxidase-like deaminating enzyme